MADQHPTHSTHEAAKPTHHVDTYGIGHFNYRTIYPGAELRIYGIGFGDEQGKHNTVLFTADNERLGINGHPTYWSDKEIHVPVPGAAKTGNVAVMKDGKFSNKLHLTISREGVLIPWLL